MNIDGIMRAAPVIPVLVLEEEMDWAALAETFVAAGLPVLEVTLRTPLALEAIRQMERVDGAVVGAGTVLNEVQLAQAIDAGSRFIVSPGLTNPLALAVRDTAIPFLPGIATAADIMRGIDLGLDRFKFFPAVMRRSKRTESLCCRLPRKRSRRNLNKRIGVCTGASSGAQPWRPG